MATVKVCDHCGKPIAKNERQISIHINDVWVKGTFNQVPPPVGFDRSWDLHLACYQDAVQGSLEAAIGAPAP